MSDIRLAYDQLLQRFLAERREIDLLHAYELGKTLQSEQVSPDELVGLHLEALEKLPPELSPEQRLQEVLSSFSMLLEMMIAYGIAYADAYRLLEETAKEAEDAKYELEKTIVELDLANHQLRDMDRLKSQFFANMSHELRTPLNAIIGFAEDSLDGLAGELNPKQARYVGNILHAGRHLLNLINDILDLAKLQSGKSTLTLSVFSLEDLLQDVQNTFQPLLQRKRQTLLVEGVAGLPPVEADQAKLYQVIVNLVSNAHKFTPEEGRIVIRCAKDEDRLRIEVEDNGIGIPTEALPTLFEEFRQVDTIRKGRQQGTGLGLAISQRIAGMHEGELLVESEVDQGSTFTLNIPYRQR